MYASATGFAVFALLCLMVFCTISWRFNLYVLAKRTHIVGFAKEVSINLLSQLVMFYMHLDVRLHEGMKVCMLARICVIVYACLHLCIRVYISFEQVHHRYVSMACVIDYLKYSYVDLRRALFSITSIR